MFSDILDVNEMVQIKKESKDTIQQLVENMQGETGEYDYLNGLSMDQLYQQTWKSIMSLPQITQSNMQSIFQKLNEYRFIHSLHHLKMGHYVRWIKTKPSQLYALSYGGIVIDIEIGQSGPMILCKTPIGKIVKYDYNAHLTYQKLSKEEKLILYATTKSNDDFSTDSDDSD